jgi:hypothetical protein
MAIKPSPQQYMRLMGPVADDIDVDITLPEDVVPLLNLLLTFTLPVFTLAWPRDIPYHVAQIL